MIRDLNQILKYTKLNGDCLEWTRCLNSDGYPRAVFDNYENGKVHREVFFLTNGFYPEVVRHKCDNTKCLNPEHLEAGTHSDNMIDRHKRGRTYHQISDEIKKLVILLREIESLPYKEIANQLGIHWKQVDYILYRQRKES